MTTFLGYCVVLATVLNFFFAHPSFAFRSHASQLRHTARQQALRYRSVNKGWNVVCSSVPNQRNLVDDVSRKLKEISISVFTSSLLISSSFCLGPAANAEISPLPNSQNAVTLSQSTTTESGSKSAIAVDQLSKPLVESKFGNFDLGKQLENLDITKQLGSMDINKQLERIKLPSNPSELIDDLKGVHIPQPGEEVVLPTGGRFKIPSKLEPLQGIVQSTPEVPKYKFNVPPEKSQRELMLELDAKATAQKKAQEEAAAAAKKQAEEEAAATKKKAEAAAAAAAKTKQEEEAAAAKRRAEAEAAAASKQRADQAAAAAKQKEAQDTAALADKLPAAPAEAPRPPPARPIRTRVARPAEAPPAPAPPADAPASAPASPPTPPPAPVAPPEAPRVELRRARPAPKGTEAPAEKAASPAGEKGDKGEKPVDKLSDAEKAALSQRLDKAAAAARKRVADLQGLAGLAEERLKQLQAEERAAEDAAEAAKKAACEGQFICVKAILGF